MPINFQDKFNELFGDDGGIQSSPTLQDVVPGLVDTGGSRFASKELNTGRAAVSNRSFRSPRVRSAEDAFTRGATTSPGRSSPSASNFNLDVSGGFPAISYSGPSGGEDSAAAAVGNRLGSTIFSGLAGSAAMGTLGGLAMGAPLGLSTQFGVGGAMSSLVSPMGLAGLANMIGGGIYAGQLGEEASESDEAFSSEQRGQIGAAAANAAMNPLGLIGQIGQNIFSPLPGEDEVSHTEMLALEAAGQTETSARHQNQINVNPASGTNFNNIQSEMEGINADITAATGEGVGTVGPGEGLGMTGVTGNAVATGNVQGLFGQGGVAGQEGPTGGNTASMTGNLGQAPTGRGGPVGIGSSGTGTVGSATGQSGIGSPTGHGDGDGPGAK